MKTWENTYFPYKILPINILFPKAIPETGDFPANRPLGQKNRTLKKYQKQNDRMSKAENRKAYRK